MDKVGTTAWDNVCIEAIGHMLPESKLSNFDLLSKLGSSLPHILKLFNKRAIPNREQDDFIYHFFGIKTRYAWPRGTLPSQIGSKVSAQVLNNSNIDKNSIDICCFVSVSRDGDEPATASRIHNSLKLRSDCQSFDISNACFGLNSAISMFGNLIENNVINRALIVGYENCIHDSFADWIDRNFEFENSSVEEINEYLKPRISAYFTIGAGSFAMVLSSKNYLQRLGQTGTSDNRSHTYCADILGSGFICDTGGTYDCEGTAAPCESSAIFDGTKMNKCGTNLTRMIDKDSKFEEWIDRCVLQLNGWKISDIKHCITHQPGIKMMLSMCGASKYYDIKKINVIYEDYGNQGSVSVATQMALGDLYGMYEYNEIIPVMWAGSGMNVALMFIKWKKQKKQQSGKSCLQSRL